MFDMYSSNLAINYEVDNTEDARMIKVIIAKISKPYIYILRWSL